MRKRRTTMADGRYLIYYTFGEGSESTDSGLPSGAPAPAVRDAPAPRMRWNPVLDQWVVVAAHRQGRTFLPSADSCPLCPTKDPASPTEIPESDFEVVAFENRFPSFVGGSPDAKETGDDLYGVQPARGACEVVVYTPEHGSTLAQQSTEQVANVVDVWADRFEELGGLEYVKYVYVFENKGEEMGVTLHHPHCQIYALPYVPPVLEKELQSSHAHHERTGECLFCRILDRETTAGTRVVFEGPHHVAFVPFYARWPYEVHVLPKRHVTSLAEMDGPVRRDLARTLKAVAMKYDGLFGFSLPYLMAMHQRPSDGGDYAHYHFHVEFYPPYRSRDRLKYLAGVELGAGTYLNDTEPEEKARELRELAPTTGESDDL